MFLSPSFTLKKFISLEKKLQTSTPKNLSFMSIGFIVAINFILVNSALSADKIYDLEDLEILAKEGNLHEYFQHYLDPPPKNRQDRYKRTLSQMTLKLIEKSIRERLFTLDHLKEIQKISYNPSIKNHDLIQAMREKYFFLFLENCKNTYTKDLPTQSSLEIIAKSNPCYAHLNTHLSLEDGKLYNPDYAYNLLNDSNLTAFHEDLEFLILKSLAKSETQGLYCSRFPFLQSVLKFSMRNTPLNSQKRSQLMAILDSKCQLILYQQFSKLIYNGKISLREDLYNLFMDLKLFSKAFNAAYDSKIHEAYSLTIFFDIQNPGEDLNLSWALIQKLGDSFPKRMEILKHLDEFMPFPGGKLFRFSFLNGEVLPEKEKGHLTHLSKYFPEYFDRYGELCIQYLKGDNTQAKLPTKEEVKILHCPNFFRSPYAPLKWKKIFQAL